MKLYNTLTRRVEPLQPITQGKITLYTCGLTVYSHPHIGNWVAYIYWDILVRVLRAEGYMITRVQNITDVGHLVSDDDSGEDKMEKGARSEGTTAWDIAEKYIKIADSEAFELLDLVRPDAMPRATDYIQQQIDFVRALEAKGYTYIIDDEGVYFDTAQLSDYGKLAKLDIEGLQAGARVPNDRKRNPTDFSLWKFSPTDKQRDMEWDSPWGIGFPGWHLECSVMARELLGDQIDIHTGGIDHIPVHHTNEIAQTEALTGKPFAKTWLHNNHLKVDNGKMAKSLGNVYTLPDIRDKGYDIEAFKVLILSSHYQTGGNFHWDILSAAQNRLQGYRAMADLVLQPVATDQWIKQTTLLSTLQDALADNLNTPEALAILNDFASKADNQLVPQQEVASFKAILQGIDSLLGLHLSNREDITAEQKALIERRQQARENNKWAEADSIRDDLAQQGIALRDTAYGQIWSRLNA